MTEPAMGSPEQRADIVAVASTYAAMYPDWTADQCLDVAVSEYDAHSHVDWTLLRAEWEAAG